MSNGQRWDHADRIPGINLTDDQYKVVVKTGLTSLLAGPSSPSWLEQLFLQKCHAVYPDLVNARSERTFVRNDDELTSTITGVVGDEGLCRYHMGEYLSTLSKYTGNACLWEYEWDTDVSCQPNDQLNTWSVWNRRAQDRRTDVTYPSDTEHNLRIWRNYFVQNRIWGDGRLHEHYNLYWRNTLIPAHELMHLFATNQHKFALNRHTGACERDMTDDEIERRLRLTRPHRRTRVGGVDRSDAYHDEWTASVANANVFLMHIRHHYRNSRHPRHRRIYQLHAVQGLLYLVTLVVRMQRSVRAIANADEKARGERVLELGELWTRLSVSTPADMTDVIGMVTSGGWPNTYLKHVSALMYAIAFFQQDDSPRFIQSILTADIWRTDVYHAFRRKSVAPCMWISSTSPRPVAHWISERPRG